MNISHFVSFNISSQPFIILVQLDINPNFSDFSSHGISDHAASDFYIKSDFDGTPLGTWHIRPNATNDLDLQHSWKSWNVDTISDETPIFLYFHGMAFNRAHSHRVEVYKLLSRLGYHVMTIDYRGFGNSGGYPKGELDVVADAISLLRYARSLAPHSPVFIWGSSLGTGIAGSLMKVLNETGELRPPEGIILDAPFTNVVAAAYHSPQGKAMRVVLILRHLLQHIFSSLGIAYDSEANFQRANCPILILHSADDRIVPIQLGKTLYSTLKKANMDVTFKNLGFQGFGHNRNHAYPGAPSLIRDFVKHAISVAK
ncbi:unnamed protein product [Hymenolepis diminuta]|uniref:Serine aminopeptidase S33 domain-containing protein n=2 Tax=Hymenolepis diminuta TaxID=6216 RepID=A0A564Z6Q1_HYMDI|nr:unnamed protein product [Hymenolepis diminuta]